MAIYVIVALVAVAVTLLVSIPVTANLSVKKKAEKDAETIGTAEVKARSIIDEALKTAETKKREALLEVASTPTFHISVDSHLVSSFPYLSKMKPVVVELFCPFKS